MCFSTPNHDDFMIKQKRHEASESGKVYDFEIGINEPEAYWRRRAGGLADNMLG
jgi:hypothetical protein